MVANTIFAPETWATWRFDPANASASMSFHSAACRPNVFVSLEAPPFEHKVDYLSEAFESQRSKP